MFLAWLLFDGGLCLAVHLGSIFGAGVALGARVEAASFGFGPSLEKSWRGIKWRLGPLPLGGYVRFQGADPGAPPEPGAFSWLSRPRRALIDVSGCLALCLVAVFLLGPARSWHGFSSAFAQALQIVLHPAAASALVGRWCSLLAGPAPLALGMLATKVAAFNLLPLPALNGWALLRDLVRAPGWRGPREGGFLDRWAPVLLLPGIAFAFCCSWSIISFAWSL